jgi:galactokinase
MGATATPFRGRVTTTIPVGAGLSSSAALELATALALGFTGNAVQLAQLGRRAEHRASGVPCGIMDQLCIAAGVAGHALMIDCHTLDIDPVQLPDNMSVVVQFVAHRTLAGSEYAERVKQCAVAEQTIGPLRTASLDDVATLTDPVIQRRARHVVSENQRVRDFANALRVGDVAAAGQLMIESHDSLRDDYATSTPAVDRAVAEMCASPGVFGARMTGGGFGGCIVAIAEPGAVSNGWLVRAVDGASMNEPESRS